MVLCSRCNDGILAKTGNSVRIVQAIYECMDGFILRLFLLPSLLIHRIALQPVNTTEQSFTSESSV